MASTTLVLDFRKRFTWPILTNQRFAWPTLEQLRKLLTCRKLERCSKVYTLAENRRGKHEAKFVYISKNCSKMWIMFHSPQQGDLRLLGPPSGQSAEVGSNPRQKVSCRYQGGLASHCATDALSVEEIPSWFGPHQRRLRPKADRKLKIAEHVTT
ncbi:hypothetical protein PoB_002786600 [Plakobranchus ocellatus]|uniref:Uncharacterized protein n=1 Tax=Plakobranchus ocellatus TaxID=259542 RepID=A0AAV3ZQM7_9GAST|nr:hypothetical protein PoB_002786600 [Plakobranchus ocellatus]